MSGIIAKVLSAPLSLVFFMAGVSKISPILHAETYHMLTGKFRTTLVPALEQFLKGLGISLSIPSDQFKMAIGAVELACTALLWTGRKGATLAGLTLGTVMVGAAFTHVLTKEDPSFPAGLAVAAFLVAFLSSMKKSSGSKKSK